MSNKLRHFTAVLAIFAISITPAFAETERAASHAKKKELEASQAPKTNWLKDGWPYLAGATVAVIGGVYACSRAASRNDPRDFGSAQDSAISQLLRTISRRTQAGSLAVEHLNSPSQLDQRLDFLEGLFLNQALAYIQDQNLVDHIRSRRMNAERLVHLLRVISQILQTGQEQPALLRGTTGDGDILAWLPQYERLPSMEARMAEVRRALSPAECDLFGAALEHAQSGECTELDRQILRRFFREIPVAAMVPRLLNEFAQTFLNGFLDQAFDTDGHAAFAHQHFRGLHPFVDATDRLSRLLMRLVYAVRSERSPKLDNYAAYREAADRNLEDSRDFAAYLRSQKK